MRFDKKNILFSAITLFLVIAFLETTLNLLVLISPRISQLLWLGSPTVADVQLGYRPNPGYPGHDSHGWRNPKVLDKAEIVVLGDSQTYGAGVEAKDAWPRRLESMTGKTVYAMAYGGYGPVHSLILWKEAVELKPTVIIEAMYAGNDLYDAFNIVYNMGQHPELKTSDMSLQKRVSLAEKDAPIAQHVEKMLQLGQGEAAFLQKSLHTLSEYSKLLAVMRNLRSALMFKTASSSKSDNWGKARKFAEAHSDYCQVFQAGNMKTIFTSEYRLSALNLGDVRIAEGHRIALRAIKKMADLAVKSNIQYIVTLIPTKELVFRNVWTTPSASYRTLTDNEERMWEETKEYLDQMNIKYVDTLPVLRKQLQQGAQPYPVSQDGHPSEYGHAAIAEAIASYLRNPAKK